MNDSKRPMAVSLNALSVFDNALLLKWICNPFWFRGNESATFQNAMENAFQRNAMGKIKVTFHLQRPKKSFFF